MKKLLKPAVMVVLLAPLLPFSAVLGQDAPSSSGGATSGPANFYINSALDNIEEFVVPAAGSNKVSGEIDDYSTDLELVVEDDGLQAVGLRFTNVSIPQGATISNAYIQFTVDETDSEATSLTIAIEDVGDAAAYTTALFAVTSRTYMESTVAWNNVPAWTTVGERGEAQATPDLSSLLQAVVNRSDWTSGNAVAFKISGSGKRTAESYEGDSALAPYLVVEFSDESTATTSAAVVRTQSGSKTFLDIDAPQLENELNELFQLVGSAASASSSQSWGDVLSNGSNPGMDIDFSSYQITGLGGLTSTGTLTADSLSVTDVINGEVLQVSNLGNQSTDALNEGTTNLYFTEQRAIAALSDTITYLLGLIQELQEGSGASGGESSSFTCGTSTVTYDGHDYSTVQIGDQCWFAENLQTTQYADGSAISEVTDGTAWSATSDGARAAYNNDNSNLATYGYLYNWNAVESAAGLCPTGWHVPTDEEWTTLTDGLGGAAGGAMKSAVPSWDGTNSSGFSALPGGYRGETGSFYNAGSLASFWSSSSYGSSAWFRELYSNFDGVAWSHRVRRYGKSVRCVRDAAAGSSASVPTVSSAAASDLAETTATLNGTVDGDGGDAVTATGFVWGTDASLSGASDASGSATSGSFTASLTGLTGGTTYYFSAYATNGEGTAYGDTLSFTTTAAAAAFTCGTSTVTFDSHDYSTVQIGDQCWFAENLRTTQYADGSSIPGNLDGTSWKTTTSGAQTVYGEGDSEVYSGSDDEVANLEKYGRLYNWYAVESAAGLCPTGWHVPINDEWTSLANELGGLDVAGEKMKSSSTDNPAWDGNNESGFTALPGGNRQDYNGKFFSEGTTGFWWSATQGDWMDDAYFWSLQNESDVLAEFFYDKGEGYSVRCLKNYEP